MSSPIRFLDLFAGCGGLSDGFISVPGFESVAHVEWKKAPADTLRRRLRSKHLPANESVIECDITHRDQVFQALDSIVGKSPIDLIVGGPPCQAYSIAGRVRDPNGMEDDYRNYLFEAYLAIARRYQPPVLVFENVPGMLSASPGGIPIVERIRSSFNSSQYDILADLSQAVVKMENFGLPQRRSRVIIVALHRRASRGIDTQALLAGFYLALSRRQVGKRRTVRDAIGKLPAPPMLAKGAKWTRQDWPKPKAVHPLHVARFVNARDRKIFSMLANDKLKSESVYASADALKQLYTRATGRNSAVHKYHVIDPNDQSNLIPAHLKKDGLRHIHYARHQARSITMLEAARLQGFPDDYPFTGSQGEIFEMIGNAVPPLFSKILARTLIEYFG
jgi:DNA (cytosine-5)-methyltransferase 1